MTFTSKTDLSPLFLVQAMSAENLIVKLSWNSAGRRPSICRESRLTRSFSANSLWFEERSGLARLSLEPRGGERRGVGGGAPDS